MMDSNLSISTKINRTSLIAKGKANTAINNMGHRPCVAWSEDKNAYYKDGEWVESDLEASIKPFKEMYGETVDLPLELRIVYLFVRI